MKLLHTGDLHLGKSLHESSLIEDQRNMLDRLRDEIARDDYAALVIAGDVYDRTIPGAEAVELFSDFLVTLRERFPALEICIIPGNHDSAQRLSFADRILGTQRIHIIGNPEESFTPIITEKNGERVAIFLLPFLASGTLKTVGHAETELDFSNSDTPVLLSQADLASEASRRFADALARPELSGIPSVLVAHLFTLAGRTSESERIFLGQAEQVNPALFSAFSYVALGHLHRSQKVGDRMYYSGSPLAYAFDEAGTAKNFLKVDIDAKTEGFPVSVTPIPVVPRHAVTRLSGSFADFYNDSSFDRYAADYVELTLTDDALVANPMNLLKPKFPYLLSIRQGLAAGASGADTGPRGARLDTAETIDGPSSDGLFSAEAKSDPVRDFRRFEEMLHGGVAEDRAELFAKLLGECADEA